jgi:hypothetical protein
MRMLARRKLGSEQGQSLVMFTIFLPVLALFFSFVVDGGHMFLEKRSVQNSADASALAAAQELGPAFNSACDPACRDAVTTNVRDVASDYSTRNGGPPIGNGGPATDDYCTDRYPADYFDPSLRGYPIPSSDPFYSGPDDNCFTWPWKGSDALVEVKLRSDSANFLVAAWFLTKLSSAPARAVASVFATTSSECTNFSPSNPPNDECKHIGGQQGTPNGHCMFDPPLPDGEDPDQYLPDCLKPGDNPTYGEVVAGDPHCVFAGDPPVDDPDQYLSDCRIPGHSEGGIAGTQAFTMTRRCDAIFYTGTPVTAQKTAPVLGAFAANGGVTFEGSRNKRIDTLGFDLGRCGSLLPQPPNGNPAACDTAAQNRDASCVRNLVDFGAQIPLNWPVPPPPLPTPLPVGTTWNPNLHYPGNCILLAPAGSGFIITSATLPATPGIYCVSGATAVLDIRTSTTAGDGYTFFALDGARIAINSNGTSVRFYWPSACGARPTDRPLSFTCFGRTITGYDPRTVLYSTNAFEFPLTIDPTTSQCTQAAICLNGQGGSLEGDVFAPYPLALAPPQSLTQSGGTVWVAGGAAGAGNGFIESWQLVIQGNSATYTGTGPVVGGTIVGERQGELVQGAHCHFDPPVDEPDQYLPNCVIPGEGGQQGTFEGHCEFDPPLPPGEDPDDYLPSCFRPETEYGELTASVTIGDLSMDE